MYSHNKQEQTRLEDYLMMKSLAEEQARQAEEEARQEQDALLCTPVAPKRGKWYSKVALMIRKR